MKWSYGVTTVSERIETTLPKTLLSLAHAGFSDPHIFIDNARVPPESLDAYSCTCHCPPLRAFGNWVTSAWSLYVYSPAADYFAIFQDDLITYANLRDYLERCKYPKTGYWNLYTFPSNEHGSGWHLSNQRGLGAVALVFSNEALRTLLFQKHLVERVLNEKRGHLAIDGGIVEAFKKVGWREWVHSPSLVQHIGDTSAIGNNPHPKAVSFRGEEFDARSLV